MSAKRERNLFREARFRNNEGRKLLKRGRKQLAPEIAEQIRLLLDRMDQARRQKDIAAVKTALDELEPLAQQHLTRFRKSALREYSESIGLAVLFALMLRAFVVEAFQIPSESMVPTLLVGDHLFVNKFIYGLRIPFTRTDLVHFSDPERGEVVVFIFPVEEVTTQSQLREIMTRLDAFRNRSAESSYPASLDDVQMVDLRDAWGNPFDYERTGTGTYRLSSRGPDGQAGTPDDLTDRNTAIRPGQRPCLTRENLENAKDYIKRVIGLPGDRVRVQDNIVYVNDVPIEQEQLPPSDDSPRNVFGQRLTTAVERIDDREYQVQYFGSIPDFEEITVREDHLFVMGDNRDNSADSRCWGQVPIENVKGRALFIFWSGGEQGRFLGNRWSRMFDLVE